jgi:hypothetical protein
VQAILTVSMISGEVAPEDERESVADCGMHKDRGLLTLVCSREGKGLSVRAHENSMSTWTDDAEHKDMVTVLGGHVLERVSLGRARAAEHAVFSRGGERLSVALTLRPAEGQSVRVNGAMVAAEDVMGELVGSVNEPKSEEERHSQTEQDPGGDCRGREASDVSEVSEGKVGTEYDTIEITFKPYIGLHARTVTGVRRTRKLVTSLGRPHMGTAGYRDRKGGAAQGTRLTVEDFVRRVHYMLKSVALSENMRKRNQELVSQLCEVKATHIMQLDDAVKNVEKNVQNSNLRNEVRRFKERWKHFVAFQRQVAE